MNLSGLTLKDPKSNNSSTTFVIPKKAALELLIECENDDEKLVINDVIKKFHCCKLNPETGYDLKHIRNVSNPALDKVYAETMKEYKSQAVEFKNKESKNVPKLTINDYFFICDTRDELMHLLKNGFECKNSDNEFDNMLGSSEYGIHLVKNLDVALKYKYSKKIDALYVIIVKAFFFNFLQTKPNAAAHRKLYPNPKDGGASISDLLPDESKQSIEQMYSNSLIYIFDHKDFFPEAKLRNVLPWAVLEYERKQTFDKSIFSFKRAKNKLQFKPKKQVTKLLKMDIQTNCNNQHFDESVSAHLSEFSHNTDEINETKPSVINETMADKPGCFSLSSSDEEDENGKDEEEEEEEKAIDMYQLYLDEYADVIEELYMKPPKWRIVYERTGRLDFKFQSEKKLCANLTDIRKTKLKFEDKETKTLLNVKDSTNALILAYLNKKKVANSSKALLAQRPVINIKQEKLDRMSPPSKKIESPTKRSTSSEHLAQTAQKQRQDSANILNESMQKSRQKLAELDAKKKEMEKLLLSTQQSKSVPAIKRESVEAVVSPSSHKQKRPSNFWEPDSDSEYYRGPKNRKQNDDNDDDEPNEDVILVNRINLKTPSIEYSKAYYDSNINMLDQELKNFSHLSNNNLSILKTIVASKLKIPLKNTNKNGEKKLIISNGRPRDHLFMYHVITRNEITKFDVDNLAKNLHLFKPCNTNEIYAGGLKIVKDSVYQKSARYLRRIKSLIAPKSSLLNSASLLNLSNENTNNISLNNSSKSMSNLLSDQTFCADETLNNTKKISLNEYVNKKKENTAQLSDSVSKSPSRDIVDNQIKPEPVTNPNVVPISRPLNPKIKPTLTLMDELKKTLNEKDEEEEEEEVSCGSVSSESQKKSKQKKKKKSHRYSKSKKSKKRKRKHQRHRKPKKRSNDESFSFSSFSESIDSSSDNNASSDEIESNSDDDEALSSYSYSSTSLSESSLLNVSRKKLKKKEDECVSKPKQEEKFKRDDEEEGEITSDEENEPQINSKTFHTSKNNNNYDFDSNYDINYAIFENDEAIDSLLDLSQNSNTSKQRPASNDLTSVQKPASLKSTQMSNHRSRTGLKYKPSSMRVDSVSTQQGTFSSLSSQLLSPIFPSQTNFTSFNSFASNLNTSLNTPLDSMLHNFSQNVHMSNLKSQSRSFSSNSSNLHNRSFPGPGAPFLAPYNHKINNSNNNNNNYSNSKDMFNDNQRLKNNLSHGLNQKSNPNQQFRFSNNHANYNSSYKQGRRTSQEQK